MEQLIKERTGTSSSAPTTTISKAPQSTSGSEPVSTTTTEFSALPDKLDINSSFTSASKAASFLLDTSGSQPPAPVPQSYRTGHDNASQVLGVSPGKSALYNARSPPVSRFSHTYSAVSARPHTMYTHPSFSTPASIPSDLSDIEHSEVPDSLSMKVLSLTNGQGTSTPNHRLSPREGADAQVYVATNQKQGERMTQIESENAALKAELEFIHSDRTALQKVSKANGW